MNEYYVYEWIRLDTNEPFYVGKGKDDRWRILNRGNNKHFNNIVNSIPVVVNILHDNLEEQIAYDLECWYIWQYRDIMGYDICNIDDGGFGGNLSNEAKQKISEKAKLKVGELNPFYGKEHTEGTRKKISTTQKERFKNKENHPLYGKCHSDETKRKMSKTHKNISEETRKRMRENHADVNGKNNPNSKSVICLTTKKIFITVKDAMIEYNITGNSNIGNCCRGYKMFRGEKRLVKSAGKYNGIPLVWKYITWNHGKKFRIKK